MRRFFAIAFELSFRICR